MNEATENRLIRGAFSPARHAQMPAGELDAVMARLSAAGAARRWPNNSAAIAAAVLVLAAGVLAVPPVRAAVGSAMGDLTDSFGGYFSDDDALEAPGRPVEASDRPPPWIDDGTGSRLIASGGGEHLFLTRLNGDYAFGLGSGPIMFATRNQWLQNFAGNDVVALGASPRGAEETRRFTIYGVTSGDVATVELRYRDGTVGVASSATGGFVVTADYDRDPVDVAALSADGAVLQEATVEELFGRPILPPPGEDAIVPTVLPLEPPAGLEIREGYLRLRNP